MGKLQTPSSKEEDDVELVQLVTVELRRSSSRLTCGVHEDDVAQKFCARDTYQGVLVDHPGVSGLFVGDVAKGFTGVVLDRSQSADVQRRTVWPQRADCPQVKS